jgi:pyruvate/2-oxoglutarate dehydrogenase complex dihydrolipoamide dehydrogenase (E3) component
VVVAGGGCSGAQTAEFIAERGLPVTLIEESAVIAADAPLDEGALLVRRLRRAVLILTHTVITGAGDGAVQVNGPSGVASVPCDSLVVCFGSQPDDRLRGALAGFAGKVISVGDCVSPRLVLDAIAEGAWAGFHLEAGDEAARAA